MTSENDFARDFTALPPSEDVWLSIVRHKAKISFFKAAVDILRLQYH